MRYEDESLQALRNELEQIAADGTEVWRRQERARAVRHNIWDGQSEDGRRHETALGEAALPFEGASDARIPLVDGVVQDAKDAAHTLFFRAQLQTVPVEPGDAAKSAAQTTLLRWLRDRQMRAELEVEVELAAEYMFADDPGLAIVEAGWRQDTMLQRRRLTFDELAGLYASGESNPDAVAAEDPRLEPEMLADFADLATNPLRAPEFMAWLENVYPLVTPAALKRAVRELRKTGEAELPVPVLRANRPTVAALRYMEDVFFPVGTADLQASRSIHRREWVSETTLRERAFTLGWDAEAVETAIAKGRGVSMIAGLAQTSRPRTGDVLGGPGLAVNEEDKLFEVWWSYERRADELGVPGIYCTAWHGSAPVPFKSELRPNAHGLYPFCAMPRERTGRQITESRGLSRPIATHQNEIKVQRDARSNYTQLTASPPARVRMDRGAFDLVIGPNSQIPVQREDDFSFVALPAQLPQASIEMERTTKAEVDEYVGRMTTGQDPNRVSGKQQRLGDRFLALWREVFSMVLADCQQFYSEAELQRVVGDTGESLGLTPEDIRGGFDLFVEIDARDLNLDFAMKKLEAYERVLRLDSSGSLDRGPYVEWAALSIDPILGRRSIRPQNNVTQREIDATKNALAQMAVGIEPDMPVEGVNASLRMKVMTDTLRGSPQLAQAFLAPGPFRELVGNYQAYLTQQLVQEQNKVTGRLGTAPTQGGIQSAAFAPTAEDGA